MALVFDTEFFHKKLGNDLSGLADLLLGAPRHSSGARLGGGAYVVLGPVDAIFKGISDLVETESELERYQVHAVTAGLDAQGEVSVTIREGGRAVIGHGAHEDVMVASARAYLHALNKLAAFLALPAFSPTFKVEVGRENYTTVKRLRSAVSAL